ncbi:MAG: glycerol-3-phosphate responsive antiterminator [Fusobacteriaceae bacterium]|nr:glycerol-3-phosphate responsive antiterminator [Fusobacteriaceae bacterium]MBP6322640.1 glycerol-3-phosphate responsive antiterminator [Fusobacteriaceae bacterium]MBP9510058.1 glycerol-3-phosphate responsive antiterminator [Fusobacteriaceae bacterium]
MKKDFFKILKEEEIIVALKKIEDLPYALKCKSKIIFLLCGTILNIEEITRKIRSAGKISFLHLDMISGFDSKEVLIIDFLKENSYADGIISTKPTIIKHAKKMGFLSIQRCFILDSLSLENSKKMLKEGNPDALEILPGVMPKIIKTISEKITIPLIAGGLINDSDDITAGIASGAAAISTTKKELWK